LVGFAPVFRGSTVVASVSPNGEWFAGNRREKRRLGFSRRKTVEKKKQHTQRLGQEVARAEGALWRRARWRWWLAGERRGGRRKTVTRGRECRVRERGSEV
jgi:hypothetical protein